ncbi:MAG: MFS transporter, partial [Paracoccaceae bacterium]|nr:MFS transporter [Paracoccaceae bacterium]
GVAKTLVYDRTLYIMAGLLLVGFICNLLVRPVHDSHLMDDTELAQERALQHEPTASGSAATAARGAFGAFGTVAWLAVGIPFLIGVWIALAKGAALF